MEARLAPASPLSLGLLCGIGAGALWGLVFLAPALVSGFGPLHLAVGRYLVYGALSALLLAPRWRTLRTTLTRRHVWGFVRLGLLGNLIYYVCLAAAVQLGSIALTSLVIGLLPVTVTLVGRRDHGAVPLRTLAPSLLLCASGILCIAAQALLGGDDHAGNQVVGLLCALGALASWTGFAVSNSRLLAQSPHLGAHDWNLLTGACTGLMTLPLLPLAVLLEPGTHAAADWWTLAAVSVGVAVLASLVGNALWNRMSRLLPLTLAGQMILFETLFALLYGLAWERRLPTALEVLAFGLVSLGVVLCLRAHRPSRRPELS